MRRRTAAAARVELSAQPALIGHDDSTIRTRIAQHRDRQPRTQADRALAAALPIGGLQERSGSQFSTCWQHTTRWFSTLDVAGNHGSRLGRVLVLVDLLAQGKDPASNNEQPARQYRHSEQSPPSRPIGTAAYPADRGHDPDRSEAEQDQRKSDVEQSFVSTPGQASDQGDGTAGREDEQRALKGVHHPNDERDQSNDCHNPVPPRYDTHPSPKEKLSIATSLPQGKGVQQGRTSLQR